MTPAKVGSEQLAKRAVFLDRDGVLNRAVIVDGRPYPPRHVDDVVLLDGVAESCARLREAGWLLVVVTNQPDIARGTTTMAEVEAIHSVLAERIDVDAVLVCPHDDADGCRCRKPAPGLLLVAADQLGISLSHSVMVGDRWRDIEAGKRAGCRTVFVDAGYAEAAPSGPDHKVSSLQEAVPWILTTPPEDA
jgi:D-glycero-D-manno-heptose 1,7-bisphosphate phosphatase